MTEKDILSKLPVTYSHHSKEFDDIPTINLVLTSIPVTCKTRKLKVTWTPDFLQDLQYYNAMDNRIESHYNDIQNRGIAKRQRYKDRKMYIAMIEEWSGDKINKGNGGIL